jgi:hypothetical protein
VPFCCCSLSIGCAEAAKPDGGSGHSASGTGEVALSLMKRKREARLPAMVDPVQRGE